MEEICAECIHTGLLQITLFIICLQRGKFCIDHMATSTRMDEDRSHMTMTKRILDLTLEIIHLLTGEVYEVVNKHSGEEATTSIHPHVSSPISVPQPNPSERHNKQKVLEVTKKMMELLTGEVPIRCQDVTVYFSMEEWEYLEGHKDLYKDVMMENQQILCCLKKEFQLNEKILKLSLEVICLLIGEDCMVVMKKSTEHNPTVGSPDLSTQLSKSQSPITILSQCHLKPEMLNVQKVLKVTQKMIDMMTGEVPIRCQDVTVYFSMEEWEYLEGHKDLYKDVMMENQPPLTSPDGSSNGNPPERCPRPLYSRDSTQEGHTIPHHHQHENQMDLKVEVKEEEEETYVMDYQRSTEQVGMMGTTKQEEPPLLINEDGSSNGNPPERCPRPLYSPDSTKEDQTVPHHHQSEELIYMKVEVKEDEEETCVRDDQPSTVTIGEKESSQDIRTDGCHVWNTSDGHLILSTDYNAGDRGGKKGSGYRSKLLNGEKPFCCPQCGKCFVWRGDLLRHQRSHTGERPFSCSECGKCFTQKANLIVHERFHTGVRPYSCSECGKCFTRKGDLLRHQRTHTGERPFSCLDCGKSFTQKASLILHERLHTGVRPYSCSECGKSFTQKGDLLTHQSSHMVERPFSCAECEKTFKKKSELVLHQRVHTGETFACSVCGKSFTKKYKLVTHQRVHTGEKPFPCSECGKCFSIKGNLSKHMKCHTSEKPFSCSTCGKCFTFKNSFVRHQKVHSGENAGPQSAGNVDQKSLLP